MTVDVPVDGLVPLAELARRLGVSRQAVAKRVQRLVAAGRLEAVREGRTVLVDPVAYERAVRADGDPARDELSETPPPSDASVRSELPTFRDARTERERVELEIKRLQLQERKGLLRPIAEIERVALEVGQTIARRLDHLPTLADELVSVAHKRGAEGMRERLTEIARHLREEIAGDLSRMTISDDRSEAA